jgi:hypothetical protein
MSHFVNSNIQRRIFKVYEMLHPVSRNSPVLLDTEAVDAKILRNAANSLPVDRASSPRRIESSAAPL